MADNQSKAKFLVECDEQGSTENRKILRANFQSRQDAQDWLKAYQHETSTHWISQQLKNPKKNVYHEYWTCQLSNRNKKADSKRNLACPMTIDIKIKKVNKATIKNDKQFLEREVPLPAVITIKNSHSHPTKNNHGALGFLRPTSETQEKFKSYFNDGLGPSEALRLHESKLCMEDDAALKLADASVNPTIREVIYMHERWRDANFGKDWSGDPLQRLREKIDLYKERGIDIHIHDSNKDNWSLLVVTPIMRRTQKLSAAKEIIFIDSTSSCESTQSTVTPVLVATSGGAVPIGIFVHKTQTTESYEQGFCLLKDNHPHCFGGQNAPAVFMTDNSKAEKTALENVWPEAKQLLCHFHVYQSEWRWLMDNKNGIPKDKRQNLMCTFKKIMKAMDQEALGDATLQLQEMGFESYFKRVESLLERKEEWVQLFRNHFITHRGHETNNYAEASIRILKDIILTRTKAFNVAAMVDFISTVWESYLENRLLHYAYGRMAAPRLKYENLQGTMPQGIASKIIRIGDTIYRVPSGTTSSLMYEVETSVGWCSCYSGSSGGFCKHQAVVHAEFGGVFPNLPVVDAKNRFLLGLLALGNQCPNFEFFIGLKENVPQELQIEMVRMRTQFQEGGWLDTTPPHADREDMDLERNENIENLDSAPQLEGPQIRKLIKEETENLVLEVRRMGDAPEEGEAAETYLKALTKLRQCLTHAKSSNQIVSTMIALGVAASRHTRRGGRIRVQPTSVARRREGVSRGSKRIPSGRPSLSVPPAKVAKRRPHKLSLAIKKNVASVVSHGTRS